MTSAKTASRTYPVVPLQSVCEPNPRRAPRLDRADDAPTSFVPMNAVDQRHGTIAERLTRPFSEVRKGYTYFENGDIIFAKITPCMQNGKQAVCRDLIDGFGFGSTEFHVLRPNSNLRAEYLHAFLRRPELLEDATQHFTGTVGQQRLPEAYFETLNIPLPPVAEQERIAARLGAALALVDKARRASEERVAAAEALGFAYVQESLTNSATTTVSLADCLTEVREGIGERWNERPVLGATRAGLALAKEPVGKQPERYKPVDTGTVFYNPMRILIGSIATVDDHDSPGITSPDYVVFRGKPGVLNSRWFYHWLRSSLGEELIRSLARGAVRERILFNRLAEGEIEIPPYAAQLRAAESIAQIRPLKTALAAELAAIEALPAALLREAFGGHEG